METYIVQKVKTILSECVIEAENFEEAENLVEKGLGFDVVYEDEEVTIKDGE